ncbi:SDR family oxidoreductase [Actinocatenispora rupis]|uniref:Short-chain dehydrogenase n=1 Tax=Actinocatenispora rupis TaxID=519421 RepID=A0A8J3J1H8_9ACTN|nr:SDR family oxidoreductase [Actinocatenispora rupis]GID14051.1 short-chain dehydrogenase [Actinocatenispora rupis]
MPAPAALITGGTGGIGLATAELLRGRGYRVMVAGDTVDVPAGVLAVRADTRTPAGVDTALAEVRARFGTLDVLYLDAATAASGDFDEAVAGPVKGSWFALRRALPLLNDGASVVLTVGAGLAVARGALLPLMRTLALELAPRRIRVNAVSAGPVDGVTPEAAAGVPLGRTGTTSDVAAAVAFLASDGASFITGHDLVVAGGADLYGAGR